mmetsp:Transcript_922/g.1994  ORF Transcript_922/g.1994 Transcript_922/m.1994 type:complete len:264 (+) Transcript_922:335-1126(+)
MSDRKYIGNSPKIRTSPAFPTAIPSAEAVGALHLGCCRDAASRALYLEGVRQAPRTRQEGQHPDGLKSSLPTSWLLAHGPARNKSDWSQHPHLSPPPFSLPLRCMDGDSILFNLQERRRGKIMGKSRIESSHSLSWSLSPLFWQVPPTERTSTVRFRFQRRPRSLRTLDRSATPQQSPSFFRPSLRTLFGPLFSLRESSICISPLVAGAGQEPTRGLPKVTVLVHFALCRQLSSTTHRLGSKLNVKSWCLCRGNAWQVSISTV